MTSTDPLLFHAHDHVSLADQIAELQRERKIREQVYPRWIANGTLKPGLAMKRNAALDAAIKTLEDIRHSTA
ncbi:MAG TPA: hypothetical protein VKY24_23995 [Reyranella sp.]|nr:hypothetical protein [Reyranella sp.]